MILKSDNQMPKIVTNFDVLFPFPRAFSKCLLLKIFLPKKVNVSYNNDFMSLVPTLFNFFHDLDSKILNQEFCLSKTSLWLYLRKGGDWFYY